MHAVKISSCIFFTCFINTAHTHTTKRGPTLYAVFHFSLLRGNLRLARCCKSLTGSAMHLSPHDDIDVTTVHYHNRGTGTPHAVLLPALPMNTFPLGVKALVSL